MSFASETSVKAVRKSYLCDGCGKRIEIGEPATRWAGLTEGDFGTAVYHPECREAEVGLNNDILGWQYGDDWLPLYDVEREDWPWLIEAYPAVAARMKIVTLSSTGCPPSPGNTPEQNLHDKLKDSQG